MAAAVAAVPRTAKKFMNGSEELWVFPVNFIEADADHRVADLHLWRLSAQKFALILSVVTHYPQPPEHYKALLKDLSRLEHITVEVHQSLNKPCSESLRAG